MGPEQFADWVPSTAAALIGRLYCRLSVPQYLGPFFSLFITNVPGPQKPLFLGGAPMLSHMGMAPIFDGLGLILVVTSYLDTLVISATSCPEMMPDAEVFMADLREAFMELEERVSTVR
jgi:diacylglycerol O-acyltransferase